MKDIDAKEYETASNLKKVTKAEKDAARKERAAKWDKINAGLKQKDASFVEPILPYGPDNMLKDFNGVY